ncbi:MAG: transaldolase [Ilumatobacteraceae bacterium]
MVNNLIRLSNEYGQSPWLDNLRRGFITSGQLARVRDSGIRGLTSNPTIFQKAIQGSDDYDEQFSTLIKDKHGAIDMYWEMVLHDINGALDVFAPLYESSDGDDGFVSVEVDPGLAHDAQGTLSAARELHQRVNRGNVMIKIPATADGIPAIKAMIGEGRNVNVTLIFSLDRYQQVMQAYIEGLEVLATHTVGSLPPVASVASFFISRVDTEIDRRLDNLGSPEAIELRGTAAIAQAKLAYELFQRTFSGPRWTALTNRGARPQRPLWASTSTKNPAFPDTLYVDHLIGPNTVNTLPDSTVEAFLDHGKLERTIDLNLDLAHHQWNSLQDVGIALDEVAVQLENEGVSSFQKSFDQLITALVLKMSQNG